MKYEPLVFNIPEMLGISTNTIKNHLDLYDGYVKNTNLILEKTSIFSKEYGNNPPATNEIQRRLGFEFGGMRNHEYYFSQFEGGAQTLREGTLKNKIEQQWGTVETWTTSFRQLALTRGIGWAMLYHDPHTDQLIQTWIDEHQIGQLVDLDIILALDMWEHSYLIDYISSEKNKYIDAFFTNLNWETVSNRLI